jgi:hypothetical protein
MRRVLGLQALKVLAVQARKNDKTSGVGHFKRNAVHVAGYVAVWENYVVKLSSAVV